MKKLSLCTTATKPAPRACEPQLLSPQATTNEAHMPESKEEPTPATREATAAGSLSTQRESLHEATKLTTAKTDKILKTKFKKIKVLQSFVIKSGT